MIYIQHRINTVAALENLPRQYGIEVDVRYHNNELILHHDPFHHHEEPRPEKLEEMLKTWHNTGPIILNVKTEGIEKRCINLMNKYNIMNWFFLDLSMPYFVRYSEKAMNGVIRNFAPDNLAVRFSEYEVIEYALSFAGKVKWIWMDCFTKLPLNREIYTRLKKQGFNICLVSPELQGHPIEDISKFKKQTAHLEIEAVCTKHPDLWQQSIYKATWL